MESKRELLQSLTRLGVTETEVEDFRQSTAGDLSGGDLLDVAVADGCLTYFQAARVREGRTSELVVGNYSILEEIGEGGMGVVFKALHRRMDRVVALKVIKADVATEQFVARFHQEVRAAARLNHPNAIAAYDAGDSPMGPYLVMEFIDGSDLGEIVRANGPCDVDTALRFVQQAARGIAYAHSQGVVHRDIKPANLMRDRQGVIRIADLGLAHLTADAKQDTQKRRSDSGPRVEGSLAFMSPEQSVGSTEVDGRSDIYSLGCTLFYLLTGRAVFGESTVNDFLRAHREKAPPSLCELREDVPDAVDALFQRMVAKAPEDRFASMDEVVERIEPLLDHKHPETVSSWEPEQSTVFLVESSTTLTRVVSGILDALGCHDVHAHRSGGSALANLKTLQPQVILSSIELTDLTGLELAQRVRNDFRWSPIAIVLMTAGATTAQQRSIRRMTGVVLLEKPFTGQQLRQSVTDALQSNLISDSPIAGLATRNVLIVDDSSVARKHEQRVLTDLGFERFTHADDGEPALREMERQAFDLVVLDYNMPNMDGRQLVSQIRNESNQPDVPVIMCTTEFDPDKLTEVYRLGVSAVCNKSFDAELVRNVVVRLFQ